MHSSVVTVSGRMFKTASTRLSPAEVQSAGAPASQANRK